MKKVKVEVEESKSPVEETESDANSEAAEEVQVEDSELARLKAEAAENYDKYLRSVAELDNIKKRFAKERSDLIKYAGEYLARDLLDIVDNLRRASELSVDAGSIEEFKKGIALVLEGLTGTLSRHGITGKTSVGTAFDPAVHDALVSQPSDQHEPGTVIEELKQAYFFKDKLLRPAQVVVAAEPTKGEGE